jgi:hypothetical protein
MDAFHFSCPFFVVAVFSNWETSCTSVNVGDLNFFNSATGELLGYSDQKTAINTVVRIRMPNSTLIGQFSETVASSFFNYYTSYSYSDALSNTMGQSDQQALFKNSFSITDANGVQVAFTSGGYGTFCEGGDITVHFLMLKNSTFSDQLGKFMLIASMSVKTVFDMSRDSDGNITHSVCSKVYWFLVVGNNNNEQHISMYSSSLTFHRVCFSVCVDARCSHHLLRRLHVWHLFGDRSLSTEW